MNRIETTLSSFSRTPLLATRVKSEIRAKRGWRCNGEELDALSEKALT